MRFLLAAVVLFVACRTSSSPTPAPAPAPAPAARAPERVDESGAHAAYEAKQWNRCAQLFEALAAQREGRELEDALYNAACCHARDGKSDRAFVLLDRLVRAGMRHLEHTRTDPDLESLHADPRWPPLLAAIEHNVTAWEASLGDPALRRELLALRDEDQKARSAMIANQDDPALLESMMAIDRKSTARMKEIIARHGWPGRRLVGDDGAAAAWLLVQHADADVAFQKQCLALLEKAAAAGDANPQNYAYLYDRVAVAEKRPQRYGTQFGPDREPQPIEDEANVDARRKAIGLGTMAEYREQMLRRYGPPKQP